MSSAIEVLKQMWVNEKDSKNKLKIQYPEMKEAIKWHEEHMKAISSALLALEQNHDWDKQFQILQEVQNERDYLKKEKAELKEWLEKEIVVSEQVRKNNAVLENRALNKREKHERSRLRSVAFHRKEVLKEVLDRVGVIKP